MQPSPQPPQIWWIYAGSANTLHEYATQFKRGWLNQPSRNMDVPLVVVLADADGTHFGLPFVLPEQGAQAATQTSDLTLSLPLALDVAIHDIQGSQLFNGGLLTIWLDAPKLEPVRDWDALEQGLLSLIQSLIPVYIAYHQADSSLQPVLQQIQARCGQAAQTLEAQHEVPLLRIQPSAGKPKQTLETLWNILRTGLRARNQHTEPAPSAPTATDQATDVQRIGMNVLFGESVSQRLPHRATTDGPNGQPTTPAATAQPAADDSTEPPPPPLHIKRLTGQLKPEDVGAQADVPPDDTLPNAATTAGITSEPPAQPSEPAAAMGHLATEPDDAQQRPPANTLWQEKEPADPYFYVPHKLLLHQSGHHGFIMSGASIRGRSHAHAGQYREDSFAFACSANWHIMAIADGAGSRKYARWGSKHAVNAAVRAIAAYQPQSPTPDDLSLNGQQAHLRAALRQGITQAYETLQWVAITENTPQTPLEFRDLACTLLLVVHTVVDGKHLVAAYQAGDGALILARNPHNLNDIHVLTEADQGESGGETYFLTSLSLADWLQREPSIVLSERLWLLLAMTDGIADDMLPYQQNLPKRLLPALQNSGALASHDAPARIAKLIDYDKRGSFDDRTLALLYLPNPT